MLKRVLYGWLSGVACLVIVVNACIIGGYLITSREMVLVFGINAGHLVGIAAGSVLASMTRSAGVRPNKDGSTRIRVDVARS